MRPYPLWCRVMGHRWYWDPQRPQGLYRDGQCHRCRDLEPTTQQFLGLAEHQAWEIVRGC